MPLTFDSLFTEYVISSYDKQLRLADVHGEDAWSFSMQDGEITFADKVSFSIQILGTESHINESWMWGWANRASNIPDRLLKSANQLRELGEECSITQFTDRTSTLDIVDGHTLSLIACGITDSKAYYRCPYDSGSLFVLIDDPALNLTVEDFIIRATWIIPECISNLEISNHLHAVQSYLEQLGLETELDHHTLSGKVFGRSIITAEFDDQNRLTKLESTR